MTSTPLSHWMLLFSTSGIASRMKHLFSKSPRASNFVPYKPKNYKLDVPPVCTNLFLHPRDTSNVGDLKCTPFDYFTLRGESSCLDLWSTINAGEDRFDNIIVGGGVFLKNIVRAPMYYGRLRPKNKLFFWGVGLDNPKTPPLEKDFTDRCALIGSRDFGGVSIDGDKVVFCPCASAMNRAFDIPRPLPVHEVVCFFHHNRTLKSPHVFSAFPTKHNYGDFTETLDFMASGKVVITNSYHGLYWATLLGKKVICLDKDGKFALFKWTPAYFDQEASSKLPNANEIPEYPDALAECRALNMAFYQRVLAILGA